jgi:hypothetical protein
MNKVCLIIAFQVHSMYIHTVILRSHSQCYIYHIGAQKDCVSVAREGVKFFCLIFNRYSKNQSKEQQKSLKKWWLWRPKCSMNVHSHTFALSTQYITVMYKTFFLIHGKSPSHIQIFKILNPSHKLVWFRGQEDSCITACPDPIRHYHWMVGYDLWKEYTCQSNSLNYSYLPSPWAFYPILWISASPRLLIAGLHPQNPHHFAFSVQVPQNVPFYLSYVTATTT